MTVRVKIGGGGMELSAGNIIVISGKIAQNKNSYSMKSIKSCIKFVGPPFCWTKKIIIKKNKINLVILASTS